MDKWMEERTPEKEVDPRLDTEEIAFWERLFGSRRKASPEK